MKAVKVEYQVKPEFIEENKSNIARVLEALRRRQSVSMLYSVFYLGEGRFLPVNVAAADFSELTGLAEFQAFQAALKKSDPILKPVAADLETIGVSRDLF